MGVSVKATQDHSLSQRDDDAPQEHTLILLLLPAVGGCSPTARLPPPIFSSPASPSPLRRTPNSGTTSSRSYNGHSPYFLSSSALRSRSHQHPRRAQLAHGDRSSRVVRRGFGLNFFASSKDYPRKLCYLASALTQPTNQGSFDFAWHRPLSTAMQALAEEAVRRVSAFPFV